MRRFNRRPFGIRKILPPTIIVVVILLISLLFEIDAIAQQAPDPTVLQMPQVFSYAAAAAPLVNLNLAQPPKIDDDPDGLLTIPVSVTDDGGQCVHSLSANDFSLSIDGDQSAIQWFREAPATSAALGILVDISKSMEFKSFSGRTFSKLPTAQAMVRMLIHSLGDNDSVFLATFARRFHMLQGFTTSRVEMDERIPLLEATNQLDDCDGTGIFESMIKGVKVLAHAPKASARKALLVITDGDLDTSSHGIEDAIAKAQFAGVTIYNIVVFGFPHEVEATAIRQGLARIADETGGLTFIVNWRQDAMEASSSIASDLDSQYVLGFTVPAFSSGALPVELMLRNHPKMRARAPRVVRFLPDQTHQVALPPLAILPE